MKFIDRIIQDRLLDGYKVYHGTNCYYIDKSLASTLMLENASGKMAAIIGEKDLSATDWSPFQPSYDYAKILIDRILCRFWNDDDTYSNYIFGKLGDYKDGRFNIFGSDLWFDNCEPVNTAAIRSTDNPRVYMRK